jgi:hypothetical protein
MFWVLVYQNNIWDLECQPAIVFLNQYPRFLKTPFFYKTRITFGQNPHHRTVQYRNIVFAKFFALLVYSVCKTPD